MGGSNLNNARELANPFWTRSLGMGGSFRDDARELANPTRTRSNLQLAALSAQQQCSTVACLQKYFQYLKYFICHHQITYYSSASHFRCHDELPPAAPNELRDAAPSAHRRSCAQGQSATPVAQIAQTASPSHNTTTRVQQQQGHSSHEPKVATAATEPIATTTELPLPPQKLKFKIRSE